MTFYFPFDKSLTVWLNHTLTSTPVGASLVDRFGDNAIIRGLPTFGALFWLWTTPKHPDTRPKMAAGLLAAFVVVAVSVWMQYHLFVHLRPFLDPELQFVHPAFAAKFTWERQSSFPSDTGTLFFALIAVVFQQSRKVGVLAFVWALITVGLTRVTLGWHYPSDIAGAFVLGVSSVYFSTYVASKIGSFQRLLLRRDGVGQAIDMMVFVFLADAYHLFPGLEDILHVLIKAAKMVFRHLL